MAAPTNAFPVGNTIHLKLDAEKKAAYLEALRQHKFLRRAARSVGIDPRTVYNHCKSDPVFGAEVTAIMDDCNEEVELAIWNRAVNGVKRPIVQGGKIVKEKVTLPDGKVEERPVVMTAYSDDLAKFILMGRMPEKYGNKIKIDANVRQTGVLYMPSPRDARDGELMLAGLEAARRAGKVIDVDEDLPAAGDLDLMTVEDATEFEAPGVIVDENGTPK